MRATRQRTIVQLDIALPLRGGRRMVVAGDRSQARIDPVLSLLYGKRTGSFGATATGCR